MRADADHVDAPLENALPRYHQPNVEDPEIPNPRVGIRIVGTEGEQDVAHFGIRFARRNRPYPMADPGRDLTARLRRPIVLGAHRRGEPNVE